MAKRDFKKQKIYKNHNTLKTVITIFLVLLAAAVILAVSVFFGFKKYIVYTSDGVRLEIPWLDEEDDAAYITDGGTQADDGAASPSVSPSAPAILTDTPSPSSSLSPSPSPSASPSPGG